MDNRLLIAFFIFLGAFLVLPIAMQKYQQSQMPEGAAAGVAGQAGAPAGSAAPARNPILDQPPLLNESNLIGTEWQMNLDQYKIKVTLSVGGIFYATHPLAKAITGMDYLEGRWRVEGNKLFVNTDISGKDKSIELVIAGTELYHVSSRGKVEKIERFR